MEIGVTLRNMGPQSSAAIMAGGVLAAEQLGYESVWITDHIAIPPDDAEGSGGRYTDTLTTLAWMAGMTTSIKLGAGVLILPYRPILPTAKQIATIQELSADRLLLGVGIGWMDPEFKALGVPRAERAVRSDQLLDFLEQAFSNDVVSLNGQPFLFKPRPPKPPILVGGRAPHALERAIAYGDGWLPMAKTPEQLAGPIATYRSMGEAAGKPTSVTVLTGIALDDAGAARAQLAAYAELGVERLVCALRYDTVDEYRAQLEQLADLRTA